MPILGNIEPLGTYIVNCEVKRFNYKVLVRMQTNPSPHKIVIPYVDQIYSK